MSTRIVAKDKQVRLKTFIITKQFEDDLEFCRDFDTTDAKIIRNAVHLYRLVREGKVKIASQDGQEGNISL